MADHLAELARSIRHTGAKCVADYIDRRDEMEDGHARLQAEIAYGRGYDAAMQEFGTY